MILFLISLSAVIIILLEKQHILFITPTSFYLTSRIINFTSLDPLFVSGVKKLQTGTNTQGWHLACPSDLQLNESSCLIPLSRPLCNAISLSQIIAQPLQFLHHFEILLSWCRISMYFWVWWLSFLLFYWKNSENEQIKHAHNYLYCTHDPDIFWKKQASRKFKCQ